jgi:hypothetical protein
MLEQELVEGAAVRDSLLPTLLLDGQGRGQAVPLT